MLQHHHRHYMVALRVETFYTHHHRRHYQLVDLKVLNPNGGIAMNPVTVSVGHTVNCSIIFLDQNGNPMQTTPTPDAAPTWSDSPAGATTFTVGPNGLTATDLAVATGTDAISLSLAVGGVSYSATLGVTVSPAPQALTSIQIGSTVV